MEMLIERGADLEAKNKKERTALSFAAAPSNDGTRRRQESVEAVRFLLQKGADPKAKDIRGLTPKDRAKGEKRDAVVELLEQYENDGVVRGIDVVRCMMRLRGMQFCVKPVMRR